MMTSSPAPEGSPSFEHSQQLTALVRLLAREAARVDFANQRISVVGEASHD